MTYTWMGSEIANTKHDKFWAYSRNLYEIWAQCSALVKHANVILEFFRKEKKKEEHYATT